MFSFCLLQLDATAHRAISARYDVTQYPTLLLFAKQGAVDGDEYPLKKESKLLADYMMALATSPELLERKAEQQLAADTALNSTMTLQRDTMGRFFKLFAMVNNSMEPPPTSTFYLYSSLPDTLSTRPRAT